MGNFSEFILATLNVIFKPQISATEYQRLKKIFDYHSNLPKIILANEKEMDSLARKMEHESENVKNVLKNIFLKLYKDFTQAKLCNDMTIAHYFFHELNIRTCPYCNRQYTFTIDGKNTKAAPEYDHFYDKAHFPLLAVSFYNLIPSCHTCNHIKGVKNTAKVNPYYRGFESVFRLVKGEKVLSKSEILKESKIHLALLKKNGKEYKESLIDKGNIETFGLNELYSMHDDYINNIIEKVSAYNNTTQLALVEAFQSASYSPQQVFDFVWGKYLEVAQYENKPLSKLTKDILEQLGIIR